jgi:hypothetical protein
MLACRGRQDFTNDPRLVVVQTTNIQGSLFCFSWYDEAEPDSHVERMPKIAFWNRSCGLQPLK